jgi:very-short-patch-repair endonuclease
VKCRYIRNGVYRERKNLPEAERVVDAVVEHMVKHPTESLGVVTLNQTQRELIEELLDKKFRTFKECEHFTSLHSEQGWPFFVKNLENVQGDERDVIFISTTFGPPPGLERVRQNFGPISRPEGWRRLNVLFTRARIRVELFTSMRAEDVLVDEHTPLGTKALHDYLEYARRGILEVTDEGDREPDSDFEVAVAEVLRTRGFTVKPQLGVAGFYIDIAVRNPDRPGEFLAAIECDGATYHSCASARDRDRIRQEILESLGWRGRIYRIWSSDWFYNPRRETARLLEFLEEGRTKARGAPISESEDTVTELGDGPELEDHGAIDLDLGDEEDVFVEVGNHVTYCHMDKPSEKKTVTIVSGQSSPKMHTVNEETPIARALLGLSVGEIGRLELPSGVSCSVRVLKIERFRQESA